MATIQSFTPDEMRSHFEKVEREVKPKAKELNEYLNRIAGSAVRMNALTSIKRRVASGTMTQTEVEEATQAILRRLFDGTTKLKNGKSKGEWNNGTMGSRWWDWESEDGKTTCRIAFFSKRFTEGWSLDTDYALTLDFEKE